METQAIASPEVSMTGVGDTLMAILPERTESAAPREIAEPSAALLRKSLASRGQAPRAATPDLDFATAPEGFYSVGFSGETPITGNMYDPGDPFFTQVDPMDRRRAREDYDRRLALQRGLNVQRQQARSARRDERLRAADESQRLRSAEIRARFEPGVSAPPQAAPSQIPVESAAQYADLLSPTSFSGGGHGGGIVGEVGGVPLTASQMINLMNQSAVDDRVRQGQLLTYEGRQQASQASLQRSLQTATTADIDTALRLVGISDFDNIDAATLPNPSGGEPIKGWEALDVAMEQVMNLRMGHISALGGEGFTDQGGVAADDEILRQILGE